MTDAAAGALLLRDRQPEWRRLVMLGAVGVIGIAASATFAHAVDGGAPGPDAGRLMSADPVRVVSVLAQAQTSTDRISPQVFRGSIRPESTRYIGTSALGRHYAAVGRLSELICLITVSAASEPESTCVSPSVASGSLFETSSRSSGSIAFLADGPALGAPWVRISPNLAYRPN
ncbi:MAG TPA: hypothetical protein VLL08_10530 [Kineosporiaceae bacterium]|nr:hypothetical protein [Kineosporiaceae bacterium]